MAKIEPFALREANAAAYLDLPVTKFRKLVTSGAFPKPVRLADNRERWRVDDFRAILSGEAARPTEEFGL